MTQKLMISYSRSQTSFVHHFYQTLNKAGYSIWLEQIQLPVRTGSTLAGLALGKESRRGSGRKTRLIQNR